MTKPTTTVTKGGALVPVSGESTLARLNSYLAQQPTIEDDPTEAMLKAVLQSPDPSKWEEIFNARHFKDSDKARLRLNSYRVSPSQYGGRLEFFLILDVTDLDSGETSVMTCGSEMAVAQVINAEGRHSLPIDVEVVRKPTPTKNGFHPMRFRYIGGATAPLGDPSAVVAEQ
jgi:hypothetical protein